MLKLRDISVQYGDRKVLSNCSLTLSRGERLALMGPSGCGKTTLLRVALSLSKPDSGQVLSDDAPVAAVFQEPRLLPWCTAVENVNAVLSDRPETIEEAQHWLRRMELSDSFSLYPSELSGGMQQRVSIARALACRPALLILDEALRGLDEALRERILRILAESLSGVSLLVATHSEEEAAALGCRILRYQDGRFF